MFIKFATKEHPCFYLIRWKQSRKKIPWSCFYTASPVFDFLIGLAPGVYTDLPTLQSNCNNVSVFKQGDGRGWFSMNFSHLSLLLSASPPSRPPCTALLCLQPSLCGRCMEVHPNWAAKADKLVFPSCARTPLPLGCLWQKTRQYTIWNRNLIPIPIWPQSHNSKI